MRPLRTLIVPLVAAAVAVVAGCSTIGTNDVNEASNGGPSDGTSDTAATDGDGAVPDAPLGPRELVDDTVSSGIDTALLGVRAHAAATADVNGDGWPDLFVGTFADREPESYRVRGADGPAPDRLLLGSADGFTIDADFEGRMGRTAGATFADLDKDGDPDLVVSRNPRPGPRSDAPSEIYRNDDGALVPASVLDDSRGGRAIGVVDFDGDGLLDLVLAEDRWSSDQGTALFRNDGDLQFTDVTAETGFPTGVTGLGVAIGDLDGDGTDDLVVGTSWFLSTGSGFTEGATSPLPWELHGDEDDPAHILLTDANADGRLDILAGQHFNSTLDSAIAEPVRLYLNTAGPDGEPTFTDATATSGLPELTTKSPQILLSDIDGDGDDDLVTTASYPADTVDADGDSANDGAELRLPLVALNDGPSDGQVQFNAPGTETGPHYWIDAVTLDANRDGIDDLFFAEWEPSIGSTLLLNIPAP